ncbi:MAG TPA: non-canonical purine NTP diphosphatase [Bacteroidales bacterium]
MKRIIFATNNQHKLAEIRNILAGKFEVFGLKDIGFEGDIPETGTTLLENASIKSNFVYNKFKVDCFSDDTGLEIESLGGKPGVYSARYAGEEANAEKNIEKVLHEMNNLPNRSACFKTVICLILDGKEYFFEGRIDGKIITEKRGISGFGYDPIFVPEGFNETFAEMNLNLKNQISHRALATAKLISYLETRVSGN